MMYKNPLSKFPFWGLVLVFLTLISYLVDETYFNHRYSILVDYNGQGVQTLEINFNHSNGDVKSQRFNNRNADSPSVRQRINYKTRDEVNSLSIVMFDQEARVKNLTILKEVLIKNKWGQIQQISLASNPTRVDVSNTHPSLKQALKRNGYKLILSMFMGLVVVVLLSRYQSLQPHRSALLGLFVLVMLFTLISGEVISDRTIYGDGVGQLRAAYNLYAYNVFAEQLGGPPTPDNFIEPFPAFVNSVYFRFLAFGLQAPLDFSQMHWGNLVYIVKQIHLVWIFFGQLALALFVYYLSRKFWLAAMAIILAQIFFFGNYRVVDTYYTELHGGVLLLLSSIAIYFTLIRVCIWPALACGVMLGLLALTKASFYYINLVILVVLALCLIYIALAQKKFTIKQVLVVWLTIFLGYMLILGPWVARNYVLFKSTAISDRGGIVLYIRATKNQMTPDEVRGAMYLYGPRLYHRLGEWWSYARPLANELDPQTGAWMRVNRNHSPNSFFAMVRNELRSEMAVIGSDGVSKTLNEVAKDMNQRALRIIKDDPIKHAAMSMIFLWRGMWDKTPIDFYFFKDDFDVFATEFLMLAIYLFFILGIFWSLFKKNIGLASLGVLSLGGIMFYSLLSHFLPRYMLIFNPALILFMISTFYFVFLGPKVKS